MLYTYQYASMSFFLPALRLYTYGYLLYCLSFELDCGHRFLPVGRESISMIGHVYRSLNCGPRVSRHKLTLSLSPHSHTSRVPHYCKHNTYSRSLGWPRLRMVSTIRPLPSLISVSLTFERKKGGWAGKQATTTHHLAGLTGWLTTELIPYQAFSYRDPVPRYLAWAANSMHSLLYRKHRGQW